MRTERRPAHISIPVSARTRLPDNGVPVSLSSRQHRTRADVVDVLLESVRVLADLPAFLLQVTTTSWVVYLIRP